MPRHFRQAAVFILSVAFSAVAAYAAPIDLFTFNSPEIDGPVTASIAASPTVASSVSGTSFDLSDISTVFEGTTLTGDVTFYTAGGAGGGGTMFSGPELFTGLVSSPTFLLGSFNLSGIADLGNGGPQAVTGTLVISQPGVTPEPMPLVLTGTGMLALFWILRRRPMQLRS